MTVYVVLDGDYDDSWVVGVFDSLEAAKAAFPGDWLSEPVTDGQHAEWWNGGLRIESHEVKGMP